MKGLDPGGVGRGNGKKLPVGIFFGTKCPETSGHFNKIEIVIGRRR